MPLHPIDGTPHWTYGRLGVGHVFWGDLPVRSFWNRLGFNIFYGGMATAFSDEMQNGIAFPAWLPTVLFLIVPALWFRRALKNRRRHRIGLCPHCGYDIRATPQRCPECGRVTLANH
jgi:hypothetical protein